MLEKLSSKQLELMKLKQVLLQHMQQRQTTKSNSTLVVSVDEWLLYKSHENIKEDEQTSGAGIVHGGLTAIQQLAARGQELLHEALKI